MAYDEFLADRIKTTFSSKSILFIEKNMMGGLCFMVNDKMCAGVVGNNLMARIGPEIYETAISKPFCKPMDFTGRPLRGFVFVEPEGIDLDNKLDYWIQLCIDYNPKAKSSKKK
ncbi:MAG: TfoX/Sxy family protein [Winogradskyella sp.]|nr:TfoX/Sxy family protein [Winogradskyella sp.]